MVKKSDVVVFHVRHSGDVRASSMSYVTRLVPRPYTIDLQRRRLCHLVRSPKAIYLQTLMCSIRAVEAVWQVGVYRCDCPSTNLAAHSSSSLDLGANCQNWRGTKVFLIRFAEPLVMTYRTGFKIRVSIINLKSFVGRGNDLLASME